MRLSPTKILFSALMATLASASCEAPRNCAPNTPCECQDTECFYLCDLRDQCMPHCSNFQTCGATCRDGCVHSCEEGQQCEVSCRNDCSVNCKTVGLCRAHCGEQCQARCEGSSVCDLQVGDNSSVQCLAAGSCTVECLGSCEVGCTAGACQVNFVNATPTDCGGGRWVCGRGC